MWRPGEVIPRDRNRAVCLWLILILAIISYTVVLIRETVEDENNPSTSFRQSNEGYKYPDVMVCPYEGIGCDTQGDEDDCVYSSSTTQGVTQAMFNPETDDQQDIELLADLTDEKGFCVTFYTSQLETPGGDPNPEDYVKIEVSWYPGGRDNASTTCIQQQGEWTSHSESITVFLRDSDTGALSAGMQLPYTCMTSETTSHVFNYMGIGLTKTIKLDSKNSANYRAVTTYSFMKKENKDDVADIYNPYARFSLEVAQEMFSLQTITENNRKSPLEIFGEVGGAWDLLLMLWPIFFVLAVSREPEYKARNFRKSATRVSGFAKVLATSFGFRLNEQSSARAISTSSVTVHQSISSRGTGVSSRPGQTVSPRVHSPASRGSPQSKSPNRQSAGQPASVVVTV